MNDLSSGLILLAPTNRRTYQVNHKKLNSIDIAQATCFINLSPLVGNDNDQSCSGTLHLFNPSSTTFVKHFLGRSNTIMSSDKSEDAYAAGYCNVTAAIDAVQFKWTSGDFDGTIKMWGVK